MTKKRFYIVSAKCGHVGRGKFVEKNLTIIASSRKEAAEKGRNYPRVKHHWKDAIIDVVEVSVEEYWRIRVMNYSDPYFSVRCIQEQKQYCSEMYDDIREVQKKEYSKENRNKRIIYMMKKRKIAERFSLNF